jgi:hypothetical protein
MPEPFNYMFQGSQPVQADFAGSFAKGQAQAKAERDKLAQEESARQMQADMMEVTKNPTVASITKVMSLYPQVGDKYKPLLESATAQQKQNRISQASDVFMAIGSGKRDIAMRLLEDQAAAARNAGDEQEAKSAETLRTLIESSDTGEAGDKMVFSSAGTFLAKAMGPDQFEKTYSGLFANQRAEAEAPSKLKESEAKAQKAAVDAKFAESNAAMSLQKSGWDITKIQNDIEISKQNAKIAMMNAAIAREGNDLKRKELALKVQDAQTARDDKLREKVSEVSSAQSTIDNMLSTAQMALDTPKSVVGSAAGPVSSRVLTTSQATADFEELVKTLGSQAFLTQVKSMKGMGSLSDAEGKKLEAGLQSLSLRQSPERLMSNIKEMQRLMIKARENLSNKFGAPTSPSDLRPGVEQRTVTVEY